MPPVIDANVLIHGRGKYDFDTAYTVPAVRQEMESFDAEMTFQNLDIEVREPDEDELERVREVSNSINAETSTTDEKLLALALQLDKKIVTDDRGIQNLALHLDVNFESFMREEIDRKLSWKEVCDNCGGEMSNDKCSSCGSSRSRRKLDQCSSR